MKVLYYVFKNNDDNLDHNPNKSICIEKTRCLNDAILRVAFEGSGFVLKNINGEFEITPRFQKLSP